MGLTWKKRAAVIAGGKKEVKAETLVGVRPEEAELPIRVTKSVSKRKKIRGGHRQKKVI